MVHTAKGSRELLALALLEKSNLGALPIRLLTLADALVLPSSFTSRFGSSYPSAAADPTAAGLQLPSTINPWINFSSVQSIPEGAPHTQNEKEHTGPDR